MDKMYSVELKEEVSYLLELRAKSEEDAIKKAWEKLENEEDGRDKYFNDVYETDSYAEEIEE